MKNVLLVQSEQYGSMTDTVKYCEYLSGKYEIDILTFNYGRQIADLPEGVRISYVHHSNSRLVNAVSFFSRILLRLIFRRYKCVWIEYFPYCSIIPRLFRGGKIHIDVRTLSVDSSSEIRRKENARMRRDLLSAKSVSFISEGVERQLDITTFKGRKYILPLGADVISCSNKVFDRLAVLYVGTLFNRKISDTVEGVRLFIERNPSVPITFDIVGNGDQAEYDCISNCISNNGLGNVIHMAGFVPYSGLAPFFDTHNVGLSYVPEYDCFQDQPPTKTYEYVLSGLFCLATNTRSNKEIITSENGILHDDNPESLCTALERAWSLRENLNSEKIRQTLMACQWGIIIEKYVVPIIEAI